MEELLSEITKFCAAHKMSEREFGLRALSDHKFLPQLRGELLPPNKKTDEPRSPGLKTVERVRDFMREYVSEKAAA